jgi:hypothetical protein
VSVADETLTVPAGHQSKEGERCVDLALEDLGRGRPGPQDQLIVRVAQREMDELLGHDRRRRGIVLFRPQLRDRGPERSRTRLPLDVFSQVGAVPALGQAS